MAPALRIVTLGFINPRKVVGAKVHQALVDANWVLIGGMRRYSIRIGMQIGLRPLTVAHLDIGLSDTRLTKALDWQTPAQTGRTTTPTSPLPQGEMR